MISLNVELHIKTGNNSSSPRPPFSALRTLFSICHYLQEWNETLHLEKWSTMTLGATCFLCLPVILHRLGAYNALNTDGIGWFERSGLLWTRGAQFICLD